MELNELIHQFTCHFCISAQNQDPSPLYLLPTHKGDLSILISMSGGWRRASWQDCSLDWWCGRESMRPPLESLRPMARIWPHVFWPACLVPQTRHTGWMQLSCMTLTCDIVVFLTLETDSVVYTEFIVNGFNEVVPLLRGKKKCAQRDDSLVFMSRYLYD